MTSYRNVFMSFAALLLSHNTSWAAGKRTSSTTTTTTSARVDNSSLNAFPAIGDRGVLNNSVAYATTYYAMSHEVCLVRGCNNKSSKENVFSPKWTFNLLNDGSNSGIDIALAFSLLEKHGATNVVKLPVSFPFRWERLLTPDDYLTWDLNADDWRQAISFRMNPVQKISVFDSSGNLYLAKLKQLLDEGHVLTFKNAYLYNSGFPLSTALPSPSDPNSVDWGVRAGLPYYPELNSLNAMTIVGYDDSLWIDVNGNGRVDANEKGALKVADSKGTDIWNRGFFYLSYDAIRTASAVAKNPYTNRIPAIVDGVVYLQTAKAAYSPKLLAQVTLSHAQRDLIRVALQSSSSKFEPVVLNGKGGGFSFRGLSNDKINGTFIFDATDLIPAGSSSVSIDLLASLTMNELSDNSSLLKDFRLFDVQKQGEVVYSGSLALRDAAGAVIPHVIKYDLVNSKISPKASLIGKSSQMAGSTMVNFDAQGSLSQDGSALTYKWDFGDGAVAESGATTQHTYSGKGKYLARVSVSNQSGMISSAYYLVSVKDDIEPPTTPTGLKYVVTLINGQNGSGSTTEACTSKNIRFSWNLASDNTAVYRYGLFRNGVLIQVVWDVNNVVDLDYSIGAGSYVYTVAAYDSNGNVSAQSSPVTLNLDSPMMVCTK